jgi:tRNA(adenine34) deaminase
VFGCRDARSGAAGSLLNILQMPELNHRCDVRGEVRAEECARILKDFFAVRRIQTTNMQSP